MLKNVSLHHYYNITASLTSYKWPLAHCNAGYQSVNFTVNISVTVGGSVTQWSAHRTRSPAVPGQSPAPGTCRICQTLSSRVYILGHFRKLNSQLVAFWQVLFYFILFFSQLRFFFLITVFEWCTLNVAGREKCALNLQTFTLSNVTGQSLCSRLKSGFTHCFAFLIVIKFYTML